ncbi:hypothetical protein [Nocardioides jejuensis]|uniref:Uncharacterized protein n=1 Tax=Nocardioides jejuensis TaxID=2502782 RepID=A0A4R1BY78_9ACTN|nr:hypothetical protein [Nocardioides jejuensis]TCJ23029.1 hypothetical protein EPD65_11750 [Nocardioides jejuensis]
MKKFLGRIGETARGGAAGVASAQGAIGVATVSGGCWVQFGNGWALIVGGGFMLLGAWGSR